MLVGEMLRDDGILHGGFNVTTDTVTNVQLMLVQEYRQEQSRLEEEYQSRLMQEMEDNYG